LLQFSRCLSCAREVSAEWLLPHLGGVIVEAAGLVSGVLWLRAQVRAEQAACPRCGQLSGRVHSRYERRLADAPAGGRPVVIRLVVRRFFCGNPGCAAVTFAEQAGGLTAPWSRRTPPLARMLAAIALALAGRAGARLAAVLAVTVSPDTLLRLVMALPDPDPGPGAAVLGIDDFAFRRGRDYGTIVIDMDTGKPVDLLPARDAATVEAWLTAHPGTRVICRDRASAYAEAAAAAAPDAIQVADRWHLWHNLCQAAGKAVAACREVLREPAGPPPAPGDPPPPGDASPGTAVPADLERAVRQRHAEVAALRAAGQDIAAAAASLGLGESVTGRYWRAGTADQLLATVRTAPGLLDPWKQHLRQRWEQGCTSIKALHAEITAAGYAGSYSTTYSYASLFRLAAPAAPPPARPPSARQVTRWLTTDPAALDQDSATQLAAICARSPEITALAGHVTEFAKILTRRHGNRLDAWLAAADASGLPALRSFVNGIRQDYQAVRNGLTLPWNSGKVEAHVNRLKMLKRQMYGRAGLPLLRKRVLLTT
jgi:transposase